MIHEQQAFLKEDGHVGDCWRCCIAALLNVPRDSVPHFYLIAKDNSERSAIPDAQEWLNERGFVLITSDHFDYYSWYGSKGQPVQPHIVSGPTIRSKTMGDLHAVVMLGEKIVYDPHPSQAGLLAITNRELILPVLPSRDLFK